VSKSQADLFLAQSKAMIPDLETKTKHVEWQAYLAKPAPFTGGAATLADVLRHAVKTHNTKAVQDVFSGFTIPTVQGETPAPGTSRQSTPPASLQRPGVRKLAMSKLEDAQMRMRSGSLTMKDYEKIEAMYLDAAERGLVDENS
jgi:hypothetical protein